MHRLCRFSIFLSHTQHVFFFFPSSLLFHVNNGKIQRSITCMLLDLANIYFPLTSIVICPKSIVLVVLGCNSYPNQPFRTKQIYMSVFLNTLFHYIVDVGPSFPCYKHRAFSHEFLMQTPYNISLITQIQPDNFGVLLSSINDTKSRKRWCVGWFGRKSKQSTKHQNYSCATQFRISSIGILNFGYGREADLINSRFAIRFAYIENDTSIYIKETNEGKQKIISSLQITEGFSMVNIC